MHFKKNIHFECSFFVVKFICFLHKGDINEKKKNDFRIDCNISVYWLVTI